MSPPPDAPGAPKRDPWFFIPTLYFFEGLPYALVNKAVNTLLKGLGASNEAIGLTSFLYLPWTLKFLWAPWVDTLSSRRRWILTTQGLMVGVLVGITLGMLSPFPITWIIALLFVMAFLSATHDIAVDGFYLDTLDAKGQALFVGVRTTAYRIAWLTGAGLAVSLAGRCEKAWGSLVGGWMFSFSLLAVLIGVVVLFHRRYLPHPPTLPRSAGLQREPFLPLFLRSLRTWLRQPRIVAIIAFILFFRLGDALLLKMAEPFLMDPLAQGGLGLDTKQVGDIYGTVGTVFAILGGILGGVLVARGGLRRWIWPLGIIQNLFILVYWQLAVHQPGIVWIAVANGFEQLAYGLGVSAYTVYLMRTVKEEFRATHYAIATSLMAVGMMVPGAVSGYMVSWLGYPSFFLACFFLSLPGLLTLLWIPLEDPPR